MISKYVYLIEIGNGVTVAWNALWLRAVFVTEPMTGVVRQILETGKIPELCELPNGISEVELQSTMEALIDAHFLTPLDDEAKVEELRSLLSLEPVGILYLIMTDTCNLACSYCYMKDLLTSLTPRHFMSAQTIEKAINLYARMIQESGLPGQIVLYGGEPLTNREGVIHAIEYAEQLIPGVEFILNTNGVLIDETMAIFLGKHNISIGISVDGIAEVHDANRVDRGGKGTFERVRRAHDLLKKHGANVGISCTVTMDNVRELPLTLDWLLNDFGADGVDFNLLLGGSYSDPQYPELAAEALTQCFAVAEANGIEIDRLMRRVDPFVEGRFSLNDCGGSGKQFVVTPDERIGICQAFLNSGEFFFPLEEVTDPETHPLWIAWKQRSPINIPICLECEALGICGGGCFYGPYLQEGTIMGVDPVHCAHSRTTLNFLLTEMWHRMQEAWTIAAVLAINKMLFSDFSNIVSFLLDTHL